MYYELKYKCFSIKLIEKERYPRVWNIINSYVKILFIYSVNLIEFMNRIQINFVFFFERN